MADIRLFRRKSDGTFTPRRDQPVSLEKHLHELVTANMQAFLGVQHIRSEYVTGKKHKGRIDALGLDEDGNPVIVEFKRHKNENVIMQGLFYVDWLVDHRAEFEKVASEVLGADALARIDWSAPRLICIAKDFSLFDEHAVAQIDRNIDLIRYRLYGDDLFLLELVAGTTRSFENQPVEATPEPEPALAGDDEVEVGTHPYRLTVASPDVLEVFEEARSFILSLGDDVQEKILKYYVAFKRIRNFASLEIKTGKGAVYLWLPLDPADVRTGDGFAIDMTGKGHLAAGAIKIMLRTLEDVERAKPLIEESFEGRA